MGCDA